MEIAGATLAEGLFPTSSSMDDVSSNIHYMRIHDHTEQLAAVHSLPALLSRLSARPVRLIVIDSVAFHFRYDFADMALRTRLLNSMAQSLAAIAQAHQIAVVIINQMTTKVGGASSLGGEDKAFVPALGESWGHACASRLVLYWEGAVRNAFLYKSATRSESVAQYAVTVRTYFTIVVANHDFIGRRDPRHCTSGRAIRQAPQAQLSSFFCIISACP